MGGLRYTHEDAQGWLDYLDNFQPFNFWLVDGDVQVWLYEEEFDNWEDTWGFDAVLAAYHSGHGGMAADGTFQLPLGGRWNDRTWAFSNNMRLGNEQVNYLFFSTCESLRVLGGHNPIRTWAPANLGFRMLFGFETVSVDDPSYGRRFWSHWAGNESLSTAWLNASWDIDHRQAPSVVAVGATADKARKRVFDERVMDWGHPSTSFWWWRWYNAATAAGELRARNLDLPKSLLVGELRPGEPDEELVQTTLRRLGLTAPVPDDVVVGPKGVFTVPTGEASVTFAPDGARTVRLARPNLANRDQISVQRAVDEAQRAVERFALAEDVELVPDQVRTEMEAGAPSDRSGVARDLQGPFVTQTTVQFRQLINGLPVVTPDAGLVQISIDNDGTTTTIRNTTRPVERLVDRPKGSIRPPVPPDGGAPRTQPGNGQPFALAASPERALAQRWSRMLAEWPAGGRGAPLAVRVVPGSTEIGYDIRRNEAILVAQRLIEVDLGEGMRKRYRVVAPVVR